ncbi:TFIIA-alpha and beta-like factor isoform X1 [Trichechus manatus latirostris]|uniref:TFIIA-alpha and beta-like factor isoform X1 n=1 Tax=Trichechus manatus latirostris TaxID=127582 RepID=A0A2Y9D7R1_TRIMA|nr:TFIIA-alpha and beta-like factor isoform X1 [Trichechus manatus latirostris]
MACANSVPTLYRSVIEDVIERVRNLFAEEGIEEQVLKDLKQLWETKVLQSKATEDLFRNSVHSPLYTLQLPHGMHQTLQTSTASLVVPAGRSIPTFTTAELGTSNSSANFTFPSSIGYPIHVPAGVTLQTASGHLYKVNVPIIVTQTPGRASILQHPIQQVFQQLGQPSVIQTGIPQLSPSSLHATTEKPLRPETVFQQPTILYSGAVDRKQVENVTTDIFVPPGNEHKVMSEALLSQQESPQLISVPGVVFAPQVSQLDSNVKLSVSASMTQTLPGGPFSAGPRGALHQHLPDVQLRVLKNRMHGCDSVKQPRNIEEPSSLPVSEKDSNSQKDLSTPSTDDDFNEIIQIDGAGDVSSSEEIGSSRDVDGNDFLGMVDAEQLKLLEEEGDSISNDSTVNSNDNEDSQTEIVEEDPLNSGDDDSEQDVPDLFDTDNVIVCQYDKIHRNKNKWKFYLKDGVMCFGGKDFVFAKAIGDAEW